jgi:hypothetical protein
MMELGERVEKFIEQGAPQGLPALLTRCLDEAGVVGLAFIQRLYEEMYGGFTFNTELKAPAAYCLLAWGVQGLDALVEAAKRTPTSKNISLALEMLAMLATGELLRPGGAFFLTKKEIGSLVTARLGDRAPMALAARLRLQDLVLWFEDDDDAASEIAGAMQKRSMLGKDVGVAKQLFIALSARWVAINTPTLAHYGELIRDHQSEEPVFQAFFERFPQMLDPMATEVWARPNLHGFKKPDFVVRRTDDSYLIVEIECPAKPIVTVGEQLSAFVTQAVGQVAQYLDKARQHFPNFREPDGLAVIGLESSLNSAQAKTLHLENEDRKGIRIVGFDWIARRAEAITRNVMDRGIPTKTVRMV